MELLQELPSKGTLNWQETVKQQTRIVRAVSRLSESNSKRCGWKKVNNTNPEVEPSLASTGSLDSPEEGLVSLGTDIVSESQMDSSGGWKLQTEMMMLGLMDESL